MKITRLSLDQLHCDPANAREHGPINMEAIRASLQRFGQAEPLVVQSDTRRVIGGNGRLAAMRDLGWDDCEVVELELDDLQATALGIALNRTAELASWDSTTLVKLLDELRAEDALEGVGYSDSDIDALLRELEADLEPGELQDPGPGDPPEVPVSRTGDLWILGDHRLMCGDSTSEEDMARLMDGETASLLATDPPYLVDYDGTNHPADHHRKAGRTTTQDGNEVGNKRWDAYVDPETSVTFFADFLRVALAHCIERVPVYQWHATRRQTLVEQAWELNGLLAHQTLIWVKTRGVLTRSHYLWQHEPCFYGWPRGKMPEKERRPPPSERTVWQIEGDEFQDGSHATIKPLAIFERPIQFHTRPGEIVLEPFSGSGTQILAAERMKRCCRAMEIAPAFVDVAIQRWEKASRKTAALAATGQTFKEVEAERCCSTG